MSLQLEKTMVYERMIDKGHQPIDQEISKTISGTSCWRLSGGLNAGGVIVNMLPGCISGNEE